MSGSGSVNMEDRISSEENVIPISCEKKLCCKDMNEGYLNSYVNSSVI